MKTSSYILAQILGCEDVSEVEQFILVSTECHGYRGGGFTAPAGHPFGTPAPILSQAVLPDWFEVDHVRVFDEV